MWVQWRAETDEDKKKEAWMKYKELRKEVRRLVGKSKYGMWGEGSLD